LCCAVCCASLCLVCLRVPTYVSQQGGYICSSVESCATSVLRYYSSALCARVRLRTPTQQGGDAQGKWITVAFQGGCRERRFCGPRVEKFRNVPERSRRFRRDTKEGRAGRRLTICYRQRAVFLRSTGREARERSRTF
jgi:hypothetical protein